MKEEKIEGVYFEPSILDCISESFIYAFDGEDFTIGLDLTGVYLFTDCESDEEIRGMLTVLQDDLQLTDEQVCVCVVGRKSEEFNYCSKKLLPKYVAKATKSRELVLSSEDLKEILEAYGLDLEGRVIHLDFSDTDLFRELVSIAEEQEAFVDLDTINVLCREKPLEIARLKQLEVPLNCQKLYLEAIAASDSEKPVETEENASLGVGSDTGFGPDALKEEVWRRVKIATGFTCVAWIGIVLTAVIGSVLWWFPLFFSVLSLYFVHSMHGFDRNAQRVVEILTILNLVVIVVAVVFCTTSNANTAMRFVRGLWNVISRALSGAWNSIAGY